MSLSVLQPWVSELPLREQGTLLTIVRGCDLEPKQWTSTGVSYSPGRRLTAYLRWCFMVPADVREVDSQEGAFMMSKPPYPFKPAEFGHLPQHWYSHAMHALEVIVVRHPVEYVQDRATEMYNSMAVNLHLNPETRTQMIRRLSEDRILNNTVV